jgi:hypothetical protein
MSSQDKVKFVADIILKLTPAIATLVMGLIAYNFQAKSSAATLLNQREQAETQLRAALFENLIGPIGGSTSGDGLDPDHQRLLVELLMLNFHEHIEFKPLLIDTDVRLANAISDKNKARLARNSLRSVARRVRDRQVAVLMKEQESTYTIDSECEAHSLNCDFLESDSSYKQEKVWNVLSPDGKYSVRIRISDMDWENEKFKATLLIIDESSGRTRPFSFHVTSYDLPFTDNMIISRHQRFAIGVSNVDLAEEMDGGTENRVTLQAVWFPKGYILPHERPVNYQEIRDLLELDEDHKSQP